MGRAKIVFTGNFWEFFIMSLGLLLLSAVSFGLLLPYAVYWHAKYFVTHLELEVPMQQAASVPYFAAPPAQQPAIPPAA
jgi:uncharacterized membrane protein YjgN (DUF898 family)